MSKLGLWGRLASVIDKVSFDPLTSWERHVSMRQYSQAGSSHQGECHEFFQIKVDSPQISARLCAELRRPLFCRSNAAPVDGRAGKARPASALVQAASSYDV